MTKEKIYLVQSINTSGGIDRIFGGFRIKKKADKLKKELNERNQYDDYIVVTTDLE